MAKNKAFWLFGNDKTRQAVALYDPSFEQIKAQEAKGFKLLWDSAPSREKAFEYAGEAGDGDGLIYYEDDCPFCNGYRDVYHVRGTRWSDYHGRWIVFNGRACEMCMDDKDILKVTMVPQRRKATTNG